MSVILDLIPSVPDREALAALLSGDMFLGRYAANYYARGLIPSSIRRRDALAANGIDPSRICLSCWTERDIAVLEDEAHA
eukprot:5948027-Karenia_brevis.AAC.1